MNILIPNIGRRGYLVKYLKNTNSFTGKLFVSDCDNTASGLYSNNDGAFILPRIDDGEKEYIESLLELCNKENIKIVIPVIDPEILILSREMDTFRKMGILLAVSHLDVINKCYNKISMNKFLANNGFDIPVTFDSIHKFKLDFEKNRVKFPVIIKPVYGSGSDATYKVNSIKELEALFCEKMVIQEFIDGQEYGIDVFNSLKKEPLRCIIKKKISMRSGETDKAQTVKDKNIQECIIKLARKLGHICNLDCDVIMKGRKIYIIDLNPRFGGGYPATHEAGVNLLKLILDMYEEIEIGPDFNNYEENLLVMKEVGIVTAKI